MIWNSCYYYFKKCVVVNKTRVKRFSIVLIFVIAITSIIYLVLFALEQNINLYFTPQEIALQKAPNNKSIRVGGMVKTGSIKREGLNISFIITDFKNDIIVKYHGILPDLFKEKQGVVVLGKLSSNMQLTASQVLAKHDEKYMPKEVRDALLSGQSDNSVNVSDNNAMLETDSNNIIDINKTNGFKE